MPATQVEPEGFRQGINVRIGEERTADLGAGIGDSRTVFIEEVLLRFPVSVTGVAGVVDACQICGGVVVCKGVALLVVNGDDLFIAGGRSGFCGKLLAATQQSVDVGTGIGHLMEFHIEKKSFPGKNPIVLVSSYHE